MASGKIKKRRLGRLVRDILVAVTSLVIALVAIAAVVAPAHASVAMSVRPGDGQDFSGNPHHYPQQPFHYGPGHKPPTKPESPEVIYGSIIAKNGLHVSNASITIAALDSHGRGDRYGQITIGAGKTYRSVVHLAAGQYRITITLTVDGHRISQASTAHLQPGRAYDVSAVVHSGRVFSFLPVSSY